MYIWGFNASLGGLTSSSAAFRSAPVWTYPPTAVIITPPLLRFFTDRTSGLTIERKKVVGWWGTPSIFRYRLIAALSCRSIVKPHCWHTNRVPLRSLFRHPHREQVFEVPCGGNSSPSTSRLMPRQSVRIIRRFHTRDRRYILRLWSFSNPCVSARGFIARVISSWCFLARCLSLWRYFWSTRPAFLEREAFRCTLRRFSKAAMCTVARGRVSIFTHPVAGENPSRERVLESQAIFLTLFSGSGFFSGEW